MMKTRALLGAVICCLALITGNALAGSDEEAVQNTILGLAQATTDFPKTKDRQAVLKFFAADFSAIDDGEAGSLKDVEKMLTDLEEQLKGEDHIAISDKLSQIIVQISGPLAWARYDEVLTVSGSQLVAAEQSKCTAILQKTAKGWLYQHEHCSSPRIRKSSEPEKEAIPKTRCE